MKEVFNKIINSKIIWIILIVIILILGLIMLKNINIFNSDNNIKQDEPKEKIVFKLLGDSKIDIYLNDKYIEPGFIAYDENNNDISSFVIVSNTVKEEVGTYELTYTLKYKNNNVVLTRIVNVLKLNYEDTIFSLVGNDLIYIPINGEYDELGATAVLNNSDISNKIVISSNLDLNKTGEYEVTYSLVDETVIKTLTRKIIVFNIDEFFTISNLKLTNQDVIININLNEYFNSLILPNNITKTDKKIDYVVSSNGVYKFILYDNLGSSYSKEIVINNIDKTSPIGTCKATIYNDKIEVLTTANDDNKISSYKYIINDLDGKSLYSSSYEVSGIDKLEAAMVEVYDTANNKTIINCEIKDERKPIFIDGNKCSDQYIYKGVKYSLTDSQKKKLAAMIKNEYGSDLLGMKAVASHMANLYEYKKWRGNTTKSFYGYISTTTWYSSGTRKATKYDDKALQAVEDCIVNGNRILPLYIDEFDWFPYDLKNYKDESYYVPNETPVANVYGAKGTFWCLTLERRNEGNVFFYSNNKYKEYIESNN